MCNICIPNGLIYCELDGPAFFLEKPGVAIVIIPKDREIENKVIRKMEIFLHPVYNQDVHISFFPCGNMDCPIGYYKLSFSAHNTERILDDLNYHIRHRLDGPNETKVQAVLAS